jgi:hypothetical protein
VNTIWVSGPISPKLSKALENNYEKSRQYLISCDRDFQSCDANTDFWLKTLFNAGFDVEAVRDGVYNDGDEMIGHDWIVIEENDTEIIIDAAAEQFDTEPYEDKYSEIGWREQGKIVMKEASLSGGWGT